MSWGFNIAAGSKLEAHRKLDELKYVPLIAINFAKAMVDGVAARDDEPCVITIESNGHLPHNEAPSGHFAVYAGGEFKLRHYAA